MDKKRKKSLAISQIVILIFGIIAISYAIGSSVGEVGATAALPAGDSWTQIVSDGLRKPSLLTKIGNSIGDVSSEVVSRSWKGVKETITKEHLLKGSAITAAAFLVTLAISQDVEKAKAAATAAATTFGAGTFLSAAGLGPAGWAAAGLLGIYLLFSFKKQVQEQVVFECFPWSAPTGGENCELCNDQELGCTEYQCRSLGQNCELINQGTDEEACVWKNRETDYPVMSAWEGALKNEDYKYTPDNAISPPDRGVKVEYTSSADKCIPAFTEFSFGIELDELAKCKWDTQRKATYEEMIGTLSRDIAKEEHEINLKLPSKEDLENENITIQGDGEFSVYVRCEDLNGNTNPANFVFKYCISETDTTNPVIVDTSLADETPVAYNQTEIPITIEVNKPAQCRWSHQDRGYDDMEYDLTCNSALSSINPGLNYPCTGKLTGIQDNEANDFFFRCEDSQGRESNSKKITLIGTRPLVINDVGPNETIRGSEDVIRVTLTAKTSAGYDEGNSVCYYKESSQRDSYYVQFVQTNSYEHSQDLYLAEGEHSYTIKCIDEGGNADVEVANFYVETDKEAPLISRAYPQDGYLTIITNEDSVCVYSQSDCNYLFDDGLSMRSIDNEHQVEWNTQKTYYVKCQDEYENEPLPDECSIIVRPAS